MTAPVTPVPIVAYSGSLPDPSDPSTYGTRGRAVWAWEVGALYSGMNALGTATYTNALAAAEAAEAATMTAGALMWNAATNYATGTAAISPADMQTYRRNSPGGVDATDPSASASWTLVGSRFLKKAGDAMTGRLDVTLISSAALYMSGLPSNSNAFAQHSPVFANKEANSATYVGVEPSGSGAASGFYAKALEKWFAMTVDGSACYLRSGHSNNPSTPNPIIFRFGTTDRFTFNQAGTLTSYGINGRQGSAGGAVGNTINHWWTGSAVQLWVDGTNHGTITVTSDYRIKRDIRTMERPALERIAALRPVLYKYADNAELNAVGDDRQREGFIAHELAEVIPSAVEGEKDAPNQIQSLRVDALLAVLVKAVQEQQAQINELRALMGS